jgi:hypothetical protein
LETAVAALILVVAAVVFACAVITFAVNTMERTINTQDMPQLGQLKDLENSLLNQTNIIMNGTLPQLPNPTP